MSEPNKQLSDAVQELAYLKERKKLGDTSSEIETDIETARNALDTLKAQHGELSFFAKRLAKQKGREEARGFMKVHTS